MTIEFCIRDGIIGGGLLAVQGTEMEGKELGYPWREPKERADIFRMTELDDTIRHK